MRLKACQQIAQRTGTDLGPAAGTARQLRQLTSFSIAQTSAYSAAVYKTS